MTEPPKSETSKAVAVIARLARIDPSSDTLRHLSEGLLGVAVEAAAGYARDAISPATQTNYQRDWIAFAAWCEERQVDAGHLPVDPVVVAGYLASLAKTHGTSALRGRVAAIGYHYRRRGFAFATTHPVIRETLSGIGRAHGKPVRPAAALTSVEVKRLIETCAPRTSAECGTGRCFWSASPARSGVRNSRGSTSTICGSRRMPWSSTCRAARRTRRARASTSRCRACG